MTKEEIEELIGLAAGMGLYDDKNPGKRAVILGKAIKELQQEPKTGWISVSERLPEEFDDVLCSTDAEEVFIATYLGKMNDGTDCFDDNEGMMWEGDVVAWMPLPQPYKAEGSKG